MRNILKSAYFIVLFLLATNITFAQSYEDAVNTFNEGFKLAKAGTDLAGAKAKFEEVITISSSVGAEADEIRKKAESQIPTLAYKMAASKYKQKDIEGAIEGFESALELANKYNSDAIAKRCEKNIPKLYFAKGNTHFKKEEFDMAITAYQGALNLDPSYAKAYYQVGLVYKQQDNLDSTLTYLDKAIEMGLNTGDNLVARESEESARDLLLYKGVKASEKKEYQTAQNLIKQSLSYDNEFADAYYRLAEVSNKMSKSNDAIDNANLALKYEKGGKTDRAKIWFEIGTAQARLGNKSAACEAFEQARYGQFKQVAEHQMEHEVKCNQL